MYVHRTYTSLFTPNFWGLVRNYIIYNKREEMNTYDLGRFAGMHCTCTYGPYAWSICGLALLCIKLAPNYHRTSPLFSLSPCIPLCANWTYPQLRSSADEIIDNCCIYHKSQIYINLSLFLRQEGPSDIFLDVRLNFLDIFSFSLFISCLNQAWARAMGGGNNASHFTSASVGVRAGERDREGIIMQLCLKIKISHKQPLVYGLEHSADFW